MKTVYASTGGICFHETRTCLALRYGQELHDWDCDEYCRHQHTSPGGIREIPLEDATAQGRTPCTTCYRHPADARAVLLTSFKTFGHEPWEYDGVPICARCFIQHRGWRETVAWPCTSAIVLGLVPRPAEAQHG